MDRFERGYQHRWRARQGLLAVLVCAVLLVVFEGGSIKKAGEEMNHGIGRTLVLAVGRPAGSIASSLPFQSAGRHVTNLISPDVNLGDSGQGFAVANLTPGAAVSVAPVTPDAFAPASIGAPLPPRRALHTLLVTGDSMSQPLDDDIAQLLAPKGVNVVRDPHIGTSISNTLLLDWGREAQAQVKQDHPDAVVMFIGANEGFPMPDAAGAQVACCSPQWAALFATRERVMMNTYRQAGATRVYWLTLPAPRDSVRQKISRIVNAADVVAAEPWQSQIDVVDTVPVFTPGFRYRDAMSVGGQQTIVRQSDGIHLNDAGSALEAKLVVAQLEQSYTF
jgi:lysophospholipase L1-like esterase